MNHFLHDNPDLGFYIDQWIRWEEMHPLVELNSTDEDGFESAEEAKGPVEKCSNRSVGPRPKWLRTPHPWTVGNPS